MTRADAFRAAMALGFELLEMTVTPAAAAERGVMWDAVVDEIMQRASVARAPEFSPSKEAQVRSHAYTQLLSAQARLAFTPPPAPPQEPRAPTKAEECEPKAEAPTSFSEPKTPVIGTKPTTTLELVLQFVLSRPEGVKFEEVASALGFTNVEALTALATLWGHHRISRRGRRRHWLWAPIKAWPTPSFDAVMNAVVIALGDGKALDKSGIGDRVGVAFVARELGRIDDGCVSQAINQLIQKGFVTHVGASERGPHYALVEGRAEPPIH
jgi:hypothetical protein